VGDGLVTQVPALVVSTAAGMLVTRTTSTADLGEDVRNQIFTQPRAIATAAILLFVFALIPGMPKISFIFVSALIGVLAYNLFKQVKKETEEKEEVPVPAVTDTEDGLAPLDKLGLEVGYGLISLVDSQQGGELLQRIKTLRKQLAMEMGFIIPAVHIRDNLQLKPNRYAFYLKGVEIAGGELMMGHYLAITNDEKDTKIAGIKTREPAFGLPALWVPETQKEDAQAKGYVIVDPATVITTHLTEVIKAQADELLGRQEVQSLVDNLATHYPKIVEELVPKVVPIGILQRVLQRLLKERVSIRDLFAILETLADYITITRNVDILTGYVRQGLSRTITRQYQDQDGNVNVMMLSPNIEDTISQSIQHTELESFVSPDPNMVKKLITSLQKGIAHFETTGLNPIILCSPIVRSHLRKIVEKFIPNVVVLAHNEITRDVNIKSFGVVEL
jgi:flagellar biosynthesis protein FlhA